MSVPSSQPAAHASVDARGLVCPEPLMLARNRLRAMARGEVLTVTATDPSTVRDFTNLCRFMGHTLVAHEVAEGEYRFWIRKG